MKTIGILFVLLLISLIPRLWQLREYPPIIVDEPANIRDMQKLLAKPGFHPIDFEWGFGQATLVHYPAIVLIRLGLTDPFLALRATSVIMSALALIPFYYIVKTYTNTMVALATSILFSYSYYFLQFSRVGWTNIHTVTMGLFYLWSILEFVRKPSTITSVVAGVFGGILVYTYRAGEIYLLSGTLYAGVSLLLSPHGKRPWRLLALYGAMMLIVSLPWINVIARNYERYTLRERVVSVKNTNIPYHGFTKQAQIRWYQLRQTFRSWILLMPQGEIATENMRYLPYGYAILSPYLAPIYLLGFLLSIGKFKQTYPWLLIFGIGLYFGQIRTVDPPNGSRGLILLPIMYLWIALGLHAITTKFHSVRLSVIMLCIFTLVVAMNDFALYRQWMTWIRV